MSLKNVASRFRVAMTSVRMSVLKLSANLFFSTDTAQLNLLAAGASDSE